MKWGNRVTSIITDYLRHITNLFVSLENSSFVNILDEIIKASQERRTIFLVGNGISGITASHFANDLIINADNNIMEKLGFGMKVISLSDNMPFFTAVSNDYSSDQVYVKYIKAHANAQDLLILLTSTIPQKSIIEAAKFSYKRGLRVVSITGFVPNELMENSHVVYKVENEKPSYVEGIHMFLCHCLALQLRDKLRQPVVFLDRDGVINKNRTDYIKCWDEFVFLPNVEDAIRRLNDKGYAVVIITNQSAVGRKIMSGDTLNEIHEKMCQHLYHNSALISKIYCCTHTPFENCDCRKPKTGLIRQAFEELPLDIRKGIFIGDSITDVKAGLDFGLTTILLTNNNEVLSDSKVVPHYIKEDLPSAVDLILSGKFKYEGEFI